MLQRVHIFSNDSHHTWSETISTLSMKYTQVINTISSVEGQCSITHVKKIVGVEINDRKK